LLELLFIRRAILCFMRAFVTYSQLNNGILEYWQIMSVYLWKRSGFVIEYISHPVINSFTTASALTIAEAQLKVRINLPGLDLTQVATSAGCYWQ